jgi:hypothetical protein
VGILGIFFTINILYFLNIIPPIPLSLKSFGVYHSITRDSDGSFVGQEEVSGSWYEEVFSRKKITITDKNDSIYVFSAIFAPTKLNTNIVHNWQYFDELESKWVSASRAGFSIYGGRDAGYRGYSLKTSLFAGKWRVDIETPRGQLIGRVKFNVVQDPNVPELKAVVL